MGAGGALSSAAEYKGGGGGFGCSSAAPATRVQGGAAPLLPAPKGCLELQQAVPLGSRGQQVVPLGSGGQQVVPNAARGWQ